MHAGNGVRSEDLALCSALFGCVRRCYQDCYRLRTEWAAFSHKNGRFALRLLAERLGFEPRELALYGFQDRRNRPLCHLSAGLFTLVSRLPRLSGHYL